MQKLQDKEESTTEETQRILRHERGVLTPCQCTRGPERFYANTLP